jgi:hypothetical protein
MILTVIRGSGFQTHCDVFSVGTISRRNISFAMMASEAGKAKCFSIAIAIL